MSELEERESKLNPIDAHVGARIRLRRTMLGFTQERLGDAIGLTFQQVQKYERGVNRVGASRLHDLARVLDVPVGFFYDDLPGSPPSPDLIGKREVDETQSEAPSRKRETSELVEAYYRIADPAVRGRMLDLIKSLAAPR